MSMQQVTQSFLVYDLTSSAAILGTILIQTLTDSEYLGRAISILQMCQASANLGTFFVGIIAQFAGAHSWQLVALVLPWSWSLPFP